MVHLVLINIFMFYVHTAYLLVVVGNYRKPVSFFGRNIHTSVEGVLLLCAGHSTDALEHKNGEYSLIGDEKDPELGKFDKPLPCFGCGIGWFCLLLGFVCPLLWYFATILYFGSYYHKDPRERSGLAASAVAALICTIAAAITIAVMLL